MIDTTELNTHNSDEITPEQLQAIEQIMQSVKNGDENITREQARQYIKAAKQVTNSVNTDEVTIEIIPVKVCLYRNEEVLDDEGNPVLDEEGKPYICCVATGTRTARIRNVVPIDLYNRVQSEFNKKDDDKAKNEKTIDFVLEVWKLSEPFMTRKMLVQGVEGDVLTALAIRFFDRMSRL